MSEYTRLRVAHWKKYDRNEDAHRLVGRMPMDPGEVRTECVEIDGHVIRWRTWRRGPDRRWSPEDWHDVPGASA